MPPVKPLATASEFDLDFLEEDIDILPIRCCVNINVRTYNAFKIRACRELYYKTAARSDRGKPARRIAQLSKIGLETGK